MIFNERAALKERLEQLGFYEKKIVEEIHSERRELLQRIKELDQEELTVIRKQKLTAGHTYSRLVYVKKI
ncbi:hypothetical protein [Peribacillus sp. SCS-37]|uniref:hypothetical protein n=1 Tax=Paraperibacillus esterisolvens TaxID=3115296 RepID=UPI003905F7EA